MYKNSQTKWSSLVHFVPFSKVSYFCLHLAAQVLIVLLQQTKKHSTGFICSRRQAVHKSRHISASKELNRILVRLSIWLYSPLCWLPETSKQCLTEVGDQWCGGFLLGLSAGTPSFRRGRIGSCYIILCLCSVSTSLPPAQILHTKQPLPPQKVQFIFLPSAKESFLDVTKERWLPLSRSSIQFPLFLSLDYGA